MGLDIRKKYIIKILDTIKDSIKDKTDYEKLNKIYNLIYGLKIINILILYC
jgi:hypothetical protein